MNEEPREILVPPEKCDNCGADLQVNYGQRVPFRRHGWFHYVCGTRWHPKHGWSYVWGNCRANRAEHERDAAYKALVWLADHRNEVATDAVIEAIVAARAAQRTSAFGRLQVNRKVDGMYEHGL